MPSGKYQPSAEKFAEYESLKQRAHEKVNTLTRQQLRTFLKRNGRESVQMGGIQPQAIKETNEQPRNTVS